MKIADTAIENAKEAAGRAMENARELEDTMEDRIRSRPLTMVGLALGAGFVIGGGLSPLITGRLLRWGGGLALRMVVLPAISQGVTRALGLTDDDDTEGANA